MLEWRKSHGWWGRLYLGRGSPTAGGGGYTGVGEVPRVVGEAILE